MKFLAILAPLLLGAASAAPSWANWQSNCLLSDDDANYIISQEIIFLQHLNVTEAKIAANNILDPAIVEYGDSINSLRMDALGTIVENGSTTYIADTTSTDVIPQIDTLSLVHDCTNIVWQWRFYGIGPGPNPWIQGFTLFKVNAAKKVYYQYVEFNSLAWAENSGYTLVAPTTGPYAAPTSK